MFGRYGCAHLAVPTLISNCNRHQETNSYTYVDFPAGSLNGFELR